MGDFLYPHAFVEVSANSISGCGFLLITHLPNLRGYLLGAVISYFISMRVSWVIFLIVAH